MPVGISNVSYFKTAILDLCKNRESAWLTHFLRPHGRLECGMILIILLGLIFLNAVFAMAEIAIVSSRKSKLKEMATENRGGQFFFDHPGRRNARGSCYGRHRGAYFHTASFAVH